MSTDKLIKINWLSEVVNIQVTDQVPAADIKQKICEAVRAFQAFICLPKT